MKTLNLSRIALISSGLISIFLLIADIAAPQVAAASIGDMTMTPVPPNSCPNGVSFVEGQQVQLQGDGFASGAQIQLQFFAAADDSSVDLGSVNADGSGNLDTVITVPGGFSVPSAGLFQAKGSAPSGGRALLGSVLIGPITPSDVDSDGVPDFCDNCPVNANAGQEDDDLDGIGDSCDSCIGTHDLDKDGLCSDVDPCLQDPDNDVDGDSVCGDVDNCPDVSNPLQEDADGNGIGDACQTGDTCDDDLDNDNDGLTDFPNDPGCESAADTTETDPSLPCDDGIDNDGDHRIDYRLGGYSDPGCGSGLSPKEDPECNDRIDNDSDGDVDWDGNYTQFTPDPECKGLGSHDSEAIAAPDADSDGVADVIDNCPPVANPGQEDVDSDGRGDLCDNCTTIANGPAAYAAGLEGSLLSQCDKDSDGYGNACDGDLNQDGFVTALDNPIYTANLMAFIPLNLGEADMDCNGFMTALDNPFYTAQLMAFLPGPSGWACAGTVVGGCPALP